MSSQDERIADELRLKDKSKKSSGKIVNIESSLKLSKEIDISKFSSFIDTEIWKKVSKLNYKNFEEAREIVRSFNFKKRSEYQEAKRKDILPADIPSKPERVYKDYGWVSVGDWLGTGFIAYGQRDYKNFEEARKYARSLNLPNSNEWSQFTKSSNFPKNIPKTPRFFYKDKGWIDMSDWLSSDLIHHSKRIYRSFAEVKKFVRNQGIKTQMEWREFTKKNKLPIDIPADIASVYKDKGWINWGDTLKTENFRREYINFKDARKYVRNLNLKSGREWRSYYKRKDFPIDIPKTPQNAYSEEWISMGDWLGTGKIADQLKVYRPFWEARKFVRSLGFKTGKDWKAYTKTKMFPDDIPKNPWGKAYKGEYISMGDWLGTRKPQG